MGPRAGLSTLLLIGSAVLLLSIAVGNGMGNRVLGAIPARVSLATVAPVPSSSAPESSLSDATWKRTHVVSVATDPAFPDPRVTPEPEPPATPRPAPRPRSSPTPRPSPSPTDNGEPAYTSPPLPLPIVSHAPDEASPDANPSDAPTPPPSPTPGARGTAAARSGPTLPPVPMPTYNN